jgi:soluble lytic murein transglycosylase
MAKRHIALIASLLVSAAAWTAAGAPAPVPKKSTANVAVPSAHPSTIRVLSAADHRLFQKAFAAADKGDWAAAMAAGNQGSDTTARQLLQWRYALDRNSGAKFADIDAVLKLAATWPLKGTLQARAEAAIPQEMSPAQIIAWFGTREPASSIGRVRLGEALVANGQADKGGPLIARGWAEGSFDEFTENQIRSRDAAYITAESDRTRLDNLIWRSENDAAKRQMARVDSQSAAVARARILLDGGTRSAKAALAAVAQSSDPGLLYDWSRALRVEHQDDEAHSLLLRIAPGSLARDHTARWWAEVNAQARDILKTGDAKNALALVEHAGLPVSDEYAEQQFLGGFISLRFLKDPAGSIAWFQRLNANVSRPISKSRAEYWLGRAYEAMNDSANAIAHYRLAARYPETFYGQLAQARTDSQPILRVNDSDALAAEKSEIENDALMPQIRVLADLGQANDLRLFAEADARDYPSASHLKAFLRALTQWGYPQVAVRLAKNASYTGTTMLDFTHPLLALPAYKGVSAPPDPAMVLGLIRQETEFDPYAVSPAGARGLMQVMSYTAKKTARIAGLPYRPGDLLTNRNYNLQLGMIEFNGHMSYWDGSLLLAAAGYNAGDGNVRRWVAANGDPRNGAVDPIDFIEQIPFSETRNYVQRVLENTEVYRNRLSGQDMPLRIMSDLYAPASPQTVVLNAPAAGAATKATN